LLGAACHDHVEAIRTLCELGADVHTPDDNGITPVHVAADCGHAKAIRTLCELGADVNTPARLACLLCMPLS
jgi:ankyrin repeat protein